MSTGARVKNVGDKYDRRARGGVVTHEAQDQGAAPVFRPSSLARQIGRRDPWDDRVEMKKQMLQKYKGEGFRDGTTPWGEVQLSDKDLRALLRKKEAAEEAQFDGWFGEHFNKADLPTRMLGEQLNPDYFRKREEEIIRQAELAVQLKLMDLYGPRSEEDLMLKFGIEHGFVRLDKDWNVVGVQRDLDDNNKGRFAEQMNVVSRFMSDPSTPWKTVDYNTRPGGPGGVVAPDADSTPNLSDFFDLLRQ
jgi:hypothetical protein